MTIDIGLLFTALDVGKSIAEFSGILESIDAKIDRIIQSELDSGLRAMEQASFTISEQKQLLREARICLNKAVVLEESYRKIAALVGLSLCHYWLNDKQNCTKALEDALNVFPLTKSQAVKVILKTGLKTWYGAFSPTLWSKMLKYKPTYPIEEYMEEVFLKEMVKNADAAAVIRIQEAKSLHLGKPNMQWPQRIRGMFRQ